MNYQIVTKEYILANPLLMWNGMWIKCNDGIFEGYFKLY